MLKVPGSSEVIFCASATDRRDIDIAIQIEFHYAFAPPAAVIDLPGQVGAYVVAFAFYCVEQGMYLLMRKWIAASPLGMKVGQIVRNFGQGVIDLVVASYVICTEVCKCEMSALTKWHLPVRIHATSRVDCYGKRVNVATLAPAVHKEVTERAFNGWVVLSIPVCS